MDVWHQYFSQNLPSSSHANRRFVSRSDVASEIAPVFLWFVTQSELTDGAELFVTAVTVSGFPDTPPATILRPGAVALTRPSFDTSSACY